MSKKVTMFPILYHKIKTKTYIKYLSGVFPFKKYLRIKCLKTKHLQKFEFGYDISSFMS